MVVVAAALAVHVVVVVAVAASVVEGVVLVTRLHVLPHDLLAHH